MRVLLSGSRGLIGRALTEQLEGEGHVVVPLVRPISGPGPLQEGRGGEETGRRSMGVPWDPGRGVIDRTALIRHGPFEAVVHLAGAGIGDGRWTVRRRQEILASRVVSTRLLTDALVALDEVPGVLVNASAVGYYGDRGNEELTEASRPGEGFLSEVCRAWEEEAAAAEVAMRVVRLRSGVVLARHGGVLAKELPPFRLGLGARLGSGRQFVSWITLADHVAVIKRAIDDDRLAGPVNATAPQAVTNADFTRALGRALHRPALLVVPSPALRLALGRDRAQELLLASQRVRPDRLQAIGHTFAHADIDGALSSLLPS